MNEQIRIPKVLVIDESGQKLGVMETRDAVRLARSKGLDLIEVAPQARPPVCRIMDYGKFKYHQRKKEKEARKHQKELKEIRLTPQIGEHDLLYRVRNAEEFLQEGHRVRIFMPLKRRLATHREISEAKFAQFAQLLSHIASVEVPLTHQNNLMFMVLIPRKDAKKAVAAGTVKEQPPSPSVVPSATTPAPQQQTTEKPPAMDEPKVIEVISGDR